MTLLATLGYAVQAVAALGIGHHFRPLDPFGPVGGGDPPVDDGRRPVVAAGCILGIAATDSIAIIGLLLCLAGVATASLSLNLYAVAQMFAGPRAAGTWIGVQNAIGNISGIFGPIVTGILIDRGRL